MPTRPTLLVLAAGMGSRYGGLKQIDPVGPAGETIIDYSIYDALRAGFGEIVFVIRRDTDSSRRQRRFGRSRSNDQRFRGQTHCGVWVSVTRHPLEPPSQDGGGP